MALEINAGSLSTESAARETQTLNLFENNTISFLKI